MLKKVEKLFKSFQKKNRKDRLKPKSSLMKRAYTDHSATVTDNY